MIVSNRHTGLVVRSIDESLKFYHGLLELPLFKRAFEDSPAYIDALVGIPNVVLEYAKLRIPGGTILELLQYHSPAPTHNDGKPYPSNRHGCSHLALTVKQIDALYAKLVDYGIHCNSAPLRSPDGNVRVFYAHDPDGIVLEFVEDLQHAP